VCSTFVYVDRFASRRGWRLSVIAIAKSEFANGEGTVGQP